MGRMSAPVHWESQMKNFIDSYPFDKIQGINPKTALAHAVQKDGIQNSLDAIDHKNPEDFTVVFEVDSLQDPSYLSITDKGTTGLTGRPALSRSELNRIKNTERYKREKWSRFQSLGYSHPEHGDELGARGQGKFIFIGASENGEIVFDTLTDEIYRVGHWKTYENKPLMEPKEDDDARDYIKDYKLEPLENIGTRVIIPRPKPELWTSMMGCFGGNGDLYRYISSTWWEALKKGRNIILSVKNDSEVEVEPPKLYEHLKSDPSHFEPEPTKKTRVGLQGDYQGCLIKELIIARSKKKIPKELQGIAVQRGEMTVERISPRHGNSQIPPREDDHVFGWIILNSRGDRNLRKTERSSHYHIGQRVGYLGHLLLGKEGWLSKRVEEFGDKLGYAAGGRDITASHSKMLSHLNEMLRSAGYEKPARMARGKKKPVSGRRESPHDVKPQIQLDYPTKGSRRVEFGEKIGNVRARVVNYSDTTKEYQLEFSLNVKESIRARDEKKVFSLGEIKRGKLGPGEKTDWFYNQDITFEKGIHRRGHYVLSGRSYVLSGGRKSSGREVRKMVYLDRDPPLGIALIKELKSEPFEYPENKLQYKADRNWDDKKFTVIINENHPLYDKFLDDKGKIDQRYVFVCALNAVLEYDFVKEGKLVRKRMLEKIKELRTDSYEEFEETISGVSKARQELFFDAFRK